MWLVSNDSCVANQWDSLSLLCPVLSCQFVARSGARVPSRRRVSIQINKLFIINLSLLYTYIALPSEHKWVIGIGGNECCLFEQREIEEILVWRVFRRERERRSGGIQLFSGEQL